MASAQAVSGGPLVCLTNSLTTPMVWTSSDVAPTVTDQHLVMTNHTAVALQLRGKLPVNQWAWVRSIALAPSFAGSENVRFVPLDSDDFETNQFLSVAATTGAVVSGLDESGRQVDMIIPVGGSLEIRTDGALTNGDDLTLVAWGHVYDV